MTGIYKITNKNNGKSYIGQSVHCGKRLDEHCKGDQLIDEVIQLEGIENFTFEVLRECNKTELSFWEDFYIMQYDTMFPKGYNKKWNCSEDLRKILIKGSNEQNFTNINNQDNNFVIPEKEIETYFKPCDKEILSVARMQQEWHFLENRICNINELKEYYNEELKILFQAEPIEDCFLPRISQNLTYAQTNALEKLKLKVKQYNSKQPIRSLTGEHEIYNSSDKMRKNPIKLLDRWREVEFGVPLNDKVFCADGIHLYEVYNGTTFLPFVCLINKKLLNPNKITFLNKGQPIPTEKLAKTKRVDEIFIHN